MPTRPPAPGSGGRLIPPSRQWQRAARAFAEECQVTLWKDIGKRARDWLGTRSLTEATVRAAGLGYNPEDQRRSRPSWGLGEGKSIWLPRGIVIPWTIDGKLWRLNIRRPAGRPKYYSPAGFKNALYNADTLTSDRPAILVEGEFDALILGQMAGDFVVPVAAGSTSGARRPRWITRLACCPMVLVSFDAEMNKGDKAAAWWLGVLDNARRWRPLWEDANAMAQEGSDLRGWILAALGQDHISITSATHPLIKDEGSRVVQGRGRGSSRSSGRQGRHGEWLSER